MRLAHNVWLNSDINSARNFKRKFLLSKTNVRQATNEPEWWFRDDNNIIEVISAGPGKYS